MSIIQPIYDQILEVIMDQDERDFVPNRQARRAALRLLLESEDERNMQAMDFLPKVLENTQSEKSSDDPS